MMPFVQQKEGGEQRIDMSLYISILIYIHVFWNDARETVIITLEIRIVRTRDFHFHLTPFYTA